MKKIGNFYQITYKEGIVIELEERFCQVVHLHRKVIFKNNAEGFFQGGGGVLLGLQDLKKTWNFCVYSWVVLFTKANSSLFQ